MSDYVGAIDQGTTSTRFLVFDRARRDRRLGAARASADFSAPRLGRARRRGNLAQRRRRSIAEALAAARPRRRRTSPPSASPTSARRRCCGAARPARRCTTRSSGWTRAPTRSSTELARDGGKDRLRARTGLPLATYFSGLKLRWLLDNVPGARERGRGGRPAVRHDRFLAHLESHRRRQGGLHVTDVTNASRTQLMNLATLDWDDEILAAARHSARAAAGNSLVERGVRRRRGRARGRRRSPGMLGDQQAALLGPGLPQARRGEEHLWHRLFPADEHRRAPLPSTCGLLTTLGFKLGDAPAGLCARGLDRDRRRAGAMAARQSRVDHRFGRRDRGAGGSVADNGDVYFVPAFSGLYAPHWKETRARRDRRASRASPPRAISRAPRWRRPPSRRAKSSTRWRAMRRRQSRAARRRRHDGQRTSDAVPGGHSRRSRGAARR